MENQTVRKRSQSRQRKAKNKKRDNSMAWINIFGILILCGVIYAIGAFMKF